MATAVAICPEWRAAPIAPLGVGQWWPSDRADQFCLARNVTVFVFLVAAWRVYAQLCQGQHCPDRAQGRPWKGRTS